jgi:anti-sigma-K factor RskA
MTNLQRDRLLELLADQTVFGLNAEELMELEQLKKQFPDWEKDFSFELTAAAISLSSLRMTEELPADLRTKIFASADEFFSQPNDAQEQVYSSATVETKRDGETQKTFEFEPRRPVWQWLGWAFAAAACIALAVNLWLTRFQKPTEIVKTPPTIQTPTPELTPAQKRAQLLASANDAVELSLANAKNEKEFLGDVVWSNAQQTGYVRLRGLAPNDATKETYQLWIVDETQDPKTPISGGVFDVSSTGEVIVPINAQLTVKKPKAVAVSKEKPGGVVVSAPERLVAIAKV